MKNSSKRFTQSKKIAYCAILTALLLGGQFALSFVSGIEIVTVLLLCFSFTMGIWCGVMTATAFSLLRCFIFGFYPQIIILYLCYYPVFALCFALIGKINDEFYINHSTAFSIIINAILAAIILLCALSLRFGLSLIKEPPATIISIKTLLWVITGIFTILLIAFNILRIKSKNNKALIVKIFFVILLATIFTIWFTILDDIIEPLFFGWSYETALGYFYGSILTMLIQIVCTIATVSTLFYPLTHLLKKAV